MIVLADSFLQDGDFINGLYILAVILFIVGLRGLAGPQSAVRGNKIAAVGMAVAVLATLVEAGCAAEHRDGDPDGGRCDHRHGGRDPFGA